jgi:hypothetical protein
MKTRIKSAEQKKACTRNCNANEFFYRESLAAGSLDQLPAPLEHFLADA